MKTRVGVVGVGSLGQHHARLLASLDDVELVGVVDVRRARAEEIAGKYGVAAFVDARDLLTAVDAVTIAAPTVVHVELATPFLEAGLSVLVEKPIASSVADADRLVAAAARHGAVLATGHTERFNPAVAVAFPLVEAPRFIEVHRLGTFPDRSLDIDVIFDVMIHDLDLLLGFVRSDITSIEAVGVNVLTPRVDIANARLRFASGCIANLTASRISREPVRKARIFQPNSYVSIDFSAQDVDVYRVVQQDGRPSIQGGRLEIGRDEPLRRELEDFVQAIRTGRPPGVTGRDGRNALALATQVAEAITASAGISA